MDTECLRRRVAELRACAAQVGRAARAAQRREQQAARNAATDSWTTRRQDEALTVYLLADGSLEAAVAFLVHVSAGKKAFDGAATESVRAQVQAWLLARPWADLSRLLQPDTMAGRARAQAARKFVAERHLAEWVRDQNLSKGLAPPSRHLPAVVDAAYAAQPELAGLPLPPAVAARSVSAQRNW